MEMEGGRACISAGTCREHGNVFVLAESKGEMGVWWSGG